MKHLCLLLALLVVPAVVGLGCGDDDATTAPPQGNAAIRVMLTDAPADYIESAEIVVTRVYLVAEPEDEEGEVEEIDLLDEADVPLVFDLMELRDGVTALLGEVLVEPRDYHQLRLVVDDATVTLIDGYEFEDGSTTSVLKTPSAHTSGIKVDLSEPIPAEEDMITIVTVDFDVDDNFKIQGNPETPAGIKGILFTPVLKEKSRTLEEDEG